MVIRTERDEAALLPPPALLKRVSWGAIFAGAVTAVALTALMGLLGLGIGLGTLDVAQGDSVDGAPKATLIWWAVTSILATGIGAFVAARLAGIPRGLTGALHGLAVWAVASIVVLWLATSAIGFALGAASNVVSTTARVTSGVVTTAGGAAVSAGGAALPSDSQVAGARDQVVQEAMQLGRAAGMNEQDVQQAQNAIAATARDMARTPGDIGQDLQQLIDRLFQGPDAALSPQERERLITEISQRSGVSREEANRIADRWQVQANAAWQEVRRTGTDTADRVANTAVDVTDTAVDVMSKVAWAMFLISLAGLVAALIGAALGGATLGLGLLAAGAAAGHDREVVHEDYDERDDLDGAPPPPRTRR